MTKEGEKEDFDDYESNVFINCPFDKDYHELLRPLLFTVVYLGFRPRIASERSDSGETRLDKICNLIQESRLSIHDLSRLKSDAADEFYRLNMPFELGIDYGARLFGSSKMNGKRSLILETSYYDFQKALSDIAGMDIKAHHDEPEEVVAAVRNWFVETVGIRDVETQTVVWYRFQDFTTYFLRENGGRRKPEARHRSDADSRVHRPYSGLGRASTGGVIGESPERAKTSVPPATAETGALPPRRGRHRADRAAHAVRARRLVPRSAPPGAARRLSLGSAPEL